MKLALLVIFGVTIAAGLTFKYQPQYFTRFPGLPLPNIIVTSPRSGQKVPAIFVVTGYARVFESTVSLRVNDSAGKKIWSGFTTAASPDLPAGRQDAGQFGLFTTSVELKDTSVGDAITLQVFQASPRDGEPTDLVTLPLTVL